MSEANILEVFAVGLFGGWGVLSGVAQLPRYKNKLRRLDLLALIPDWSFFAPTPAQGDYSLLYRDRLSGDTSFTYWMEVLIGRPRSWSNFIWNPDRRLRKALFDVCTELARRVLDTSSIEIQGSIPYLLLLNYISEIPREVPVMATQFMVMLSHGEHSPKEPEIVYLSELHGVE